VATALETGAEHVEWDLSDLYAGPDDPRIEQDLAAAKAAAAAFRRRYAGRVGALSPPELAAATAELEEISAAMRRIGLFGQLRFDADTSDEQRARFLARAEEEATALGNQLRFFELEWAALDDDTAEERVAAPELAHYANFLRAQRRFRPHLLSEAEERVAAEKAISGIMAWGRLYSDLLSQIRVRHDGEDLSIDQARDRLRVTPEREERRRLNESTVAALETNLRTRAFVLNTAIADRAVEDRLRKYPTWLSWRNQVNEISDAAVDALVDAVVARYDIMQRHFRLRARLLGIERLADYDRFAPVSEPPRMSWSEARESITEAYASFAPVTAEIVTRFFDGNWIDAASRPGKTPGAYCAMRIPGVHPYILMTFAGSRLSALTLAHELGHGVHAVLSQDVGYFNSELPLTLAETGSVLGEAITFRHLLERSSDERERLDLVVAFIDELAGTVFGAMAANRFEDAAHNERRAEGELSASRLCELWIEVHERVYADSVEVGDGFGRFWSYYPHFPLVPGYMYAYSFGSLLSLAIYERYVEEGDAFVEPILGLLRAGGSEPPAQLARRVGFDLDDLGLWNRGLDAIEALVAEAEALADAVVG
jgi:oligoendopeptidase F